MGIGLITFSFSNPKEKPNNADELQYDNIKNKEKTKDVLKITNGLKDDGTLLEDAYPDINDLIEEYLAARVATDMDTINELVSSTNIESFVVYVYEELKIVGIDTLAPGMIRLYVQVNSEGKPIIYFGQVEDETLDFIEATGHDEKVIQLIDRVNKKLEEAMTSDKNLKAFIEALESAHKNSAPVDESKSLSEETIKNN